jgi:hypothetical protein
MKKQSIIAIIAAMMAFNSCRLVDFTLISSKNVALDVKKDTLRVTAKGWTIKDAVDNAIEKAGPGYDALIDGVIYDSGFRYKVKGTPIKTSDLKK